MHGHSGISKRIVTKVVPSSLLRRAVEVRDRRRLDAVPRREFEADHLRRLDASRLTALFRDARIDAGWSEDQERIASVFDATDVGDAVNPGDRRALYYLVAAFRPTRILEIGTNVGGSTLAMTRALRTHVGPDARLDTVDIVDVNDSVRAGEAGIRSTRTPADNLERLGLSEHVSFFVCPATEFMSRTEERYGLILVDGDHAAPSVYREISGALGVLAPDGVIVLHDYYPAPPARPRGVASIAGPADAVARIVNEAPAMAVLPLGSLPWETKPGTSWTSLALLTRAEH